jgi:hypothetical protein
LPAGPFWLQQVSVNAAAFRDMAHPNYRSLADFSVKGHPFGLDLSAEEKAELIAFLKTL